MNGIEPCSHIRQHARPILTRKFCFNCGGPRFFARRGGIAERGVGSQQASDSVEKSVERSTLKRNHSDPNDSGYHSDGIHDDDDDEDDFQLSPRATRVRVRYGRYDPPNRSSSKRRSPSRKPEWRPNLKRDLSSVETSPFSRQPAIDSTISGSDDNVTMTEQSQEQSMAPVFRKTEAPNLKVPRRRKSTLLHPSTPPVHKTTTLENKKSFPFLQPSAVTDDTTTLRSSSERKTSTLLHPSAPPVQATSKSDSSQSFIYPTSLLAQESQPLSLPLESPLSTPPHSINLPIRRPTLPPREKSTLLHPSPPTSLPPQRPAPIHAHTTSALLAINAKVKAKANITKRRGAISISGLSDDEGSDWDEPLHSSHSDAECSFDDEEDRADATAKGGESDAGGEGDTESFEDGHGIWENMDGAEEKEVMEDVILAQTARMARASRIVLHGGQLRL